MNRRRLYIRGVVSFRDRLHVFLTGDHSPADLDEMVKNARSVINKIDDILESHDVEIRELPPPTRNAYLDILNFIDYSRKEKPTDKKEIRSNQLTLTQFQEGNEADEDSIQTDSIDTNTAKSHGLFIPESITRSNTTDTITSSPPVSIDHPRVTSQGSTLIDYERLQTIANQSARRMHLGIDIRAEYYQYTRIRVTGRKRGGLYLIRVSHLLNDAPEHILDAVISSLIAKFQKKPYDKYDTLFKEYVRTEPISKRVEEHRSSNARKVLRGSRGRFHDLEKEFSVVDHQYFNGSMYGITLTWGRKSRRTLGHYDHAMQTIVISKLLDRKDVPRYVIQYILYHEMLHSLIRTYYRNGRRVVHSKEFRDREKQFAKFKDAKDFIRKLLQRTR